MNKIFCNPLPSILIIKWSTFFYTTRRKFEFRRFSVEAMPSVIVIYKTSSGSKLTNVLCTIFLELINLYTFVTPYLGLFERARLLIKIGASVKLEDSYETAFKCPDSDSKMLNFGRNLKKGRPLKKFHF